MERATLPETLTNAKFGAAVGVSERTIAGHRAARRLPLLADGRLDVPAVLRMGYQAALARGLGPRGDRPEVPKGLQHLEHPLEAAVAAVLVDFAHRLPRIAATFAVDAGAGCAAAWHISRSVALAVIMEAQDLLTEAGIPWPPGAAGWRDADLWTPERLLAINWPRLAEIAGEPHDEAAWEAARTAQNADAGDGGAPAPTARAAGRKRRTNPIHRERN